MASKPLLWTGIGLCGAGAVTLVVVAFVDLGKADQAASVTGAVVGLIGLALAFFSRFDGGPGTATQPSTDVSAAGDGAIAAGGNIGTAATGGFTPPSMPSPPASPSPSQPSGGVRATGKGSVAAGGDIGSASTGN